MNVIDVKSNTYPFVEVVLYSEIVRSICRVNHQDFPANQLLERRGRQGGAGKKRGSMEGGRREKGAGGSEGTRRRREV